MPEQILDRAQVSATGQQMRRERVPQRVRRRVLRQPVQPPELPQRPLRHRRIQPPAARTEEQRAVRLPDPDAAPATRRQPRAPPAAPARCVPCSPLPTPAACIWPRRVAHIQRQCLGNPQPAAVQQREQRGIARLHRRGVRHLADPLGHVARLIRAPAPAAPAALPRGVAISSSAGFSTPMPPRQEPEEAPHRATAAARASHCRRRLRPPRASQARRSACRSAPSAARSGSPPRCCVRNPRKPAMIGPIGLHRQRRGPTLPPQPFEEGHAGLPRPVTASAPRGRGTARPRNAKGPAPCAGSSTCRSRASSASSAGVHPPGTAPAHHGAPAPPPRRAASRIRRRIAEHHLVPVQQPRDRPARQPPAPGWSRLDAEMRRIDRQDARHLATHAVRRIAAPQQRQHRLLHPTRQARGRAPSRQQRHPRSPAAPAASPPCGPPAPRRAPAPAAPARDTAADAPPATPDWPAGTPRRIPPRVRLIRRSAGPSSPSRPGTPPGPCRSADG